MNLAVEVEAGLAQVLEPLPLVLGACQVLHHIALVVVELPIFDDVEHLILAKVVVRRVVDEVDFPGFSVFTHHLNPSIVPAAGGTAHPAFSTIAPSCRTRMPVG